jgi:hypothetical protein
MNQGPRTSSCFAVHRLSDSARSGMTFERRLDMAETTFYQDAYGLHLSKSLGKTNVF